MTIKDIYEGKSLSVWEDEDGWVTVSIFPVSVCIPQEQWEDLKKDFKKVK